MDSEFFWDHFDRFSLVSGESRLKAKDYWVNQSAMHCFRQQYRWFFNKTLFDFDKNLPNSRKAYGLSYEQPIFAIEHFMNT